MLVALLLVLLADADDLLEDLHVEALALGFGEDLLLALVPLLDLELELLHALDERLHPMTRDPDLVRHAHAPAVARIGTIEARPFPER